MKLTDIERHQIALEAVKAELAQAKRDKTRADNRAVLAAAVVSVVFLGTLFLGWERMDRQDRRIADLQDALQRTSSDAAQAHQWSQETQARLEALDPDVLDEIRTAIEESHIRSVTNQRYLQNIIAREERM